MTKVTDDTMENVAGTFIVINLYLHQRSLRNRRTAGLGNTIRGPFPWKMPISRPAVPLPHVPIFNSNSSAALFSGV